MTFEQGFKRGMREFPKWITGHRATLEGNFKRMSRHFSPDTDLSEFTEDAMMGFVQQMLEEEYKPSTINQQLSLVSRILEGAQRWTQGAVRNFKMPRMPTTRGRIRTLPYGEEEKVLTWFYGSTRQCRERDGDMGDLVAFLIDTGFRLGEALRLESADVEWEDNLVPAWDTKNGEPRKVPMTQRVRGILHDRKDLARPFEMFSKDVAEDYWATMRKAIGINAERDPEFVLHALRHTCATRLASSGMDAFRIQKWMGHKSIQTTMIYVNLASTDLKDLATALDAGRLAAAVELEKARKSVPKSVPKDADAGHIHEPYVEVESGAESPPLKGSRPITRTGETVGVGLLIRRSLVRAQVGEPPPSRHSEEVAHKKKKTVPKSVSKK